ncbi:pericentrin [Trichomycterus rosablanca]|uniref:pericentrin n=1 Tax=Trichomycterus rosablanca TaxID=2290929 RepID=UPI002F35E6F9
MEQDERQRKLEAGRAKLAHFRQRRAKSDGATALKKTVKKKGQTVQTKDWSAQNPIIGESQNDIHLQNNMENVEESLQLADAADLAACDVSEVMDITDAQGCSTVLEDTALSEQPADTIDLLGEMVVTHTGTEQLKQLQAAVEKRNEIISQLSNNLQVALMSRDEVQLEAQQLTGQMQEMQQQLQQAKEYLRSKTLGWLDLSYVQHTQQQLHVEFSQQIFNDQQFSQNQKEITALQQKFHSTFKANSTEQDGTNLQHHKNLPGNDTSPESSFNSDSANLIQRLKSELDEERQKSKQALDHSESLLKLVESLESQKVDIEAQLMVAQAALERAESQAREAQQYKAEKEQLDQDVARLDGLVKELQNKLQEEEETVEHLRLKYEAEIGNYELRLQTLEEERGMNIAQLTEAHEAALKRLQEEHSEEVGRIQELLEKAQQQNHSFSEHSVSQELGLGLNWVKTSGENHNQEMANDSAAQAELSMDASVLEDQNDLMEKYLASAVQHESSGLEKSLEERSLLEKSASSVFDLDSEVKFAESRFSIHTDSNNTDLGLSEDQPSELDVMYFAQAKWQSFNSTSNELHESVDAIDLGNDLVQQCKVLAEQLEGDEKSLLVQQCADLTEQLEEKEKQLTVYQEEVRSSAEELKEVRERWRKASEEVEKAKWELEMEREKRLHFEELISEKMHEQDNLKNKLGYLESQLEHAQITPNNEVPVKTSSSPSSTEELLKDLNEEKLKLVLQLKQQEQLVRDIQEQKVAGDSVSSEVQALFGKQLSSLQAQRDQLMAQLEIQREKNQTANVMLGQRTLEVDSANEEIQKLCAEMKDCTENLQKLENIKANLESELTCLKQNLSNLEEALSQRTVEKAGLEERIQALDKQTKSMEKILEAELEDFELQFEAKDVDLEQMKEAKEKAEEEHMEKEGALQKELTELRLSLEEHVKNQEKEKRLLEEKHLKEIQDWSTRLETELSVLRSSLEEEQKKQISVIKQVHEREHHRELGQVAAQHTEALEQLKAELSEELRDSMEAAHQAELSQAQTHKALELEALRLSLTNLHTAQLELTETNLQKEKEAALSELQANLREKWAQESAMLQTRQQFELEKIREQSREQERRAQLQHQQEINDLKCEWEKRILEQQQSSKVEVKFSVYQFLHIYSLLFYVLTCNTLLNILFQELKAALNKAEKHLAETQHRLDELQCSKETDIKHLEEELSQAWADRDSAARAVEELAAKHKVVLQDQQAHVQNLEMKEKQLQQEVDRLLTEQEAQKASAEQEIANLWSQLESVRTSRKELGELKEQLLARSSCVDDIEQLKQEFSQQRRELQKQNEVELENLRTYFEQRLRVTEENYREEIALLQLRLVEGALEESVLRTGESSFLLEENVQEERSDALAEITEQLEKHKVELDSLRLQLEEKHKMELEQLRCNMALSYKEELLQARTELTDRYYSDIEQLKNKHALEIEKLRAKLSDSHLKDITKLRLQSAAEVARQVEAELEERVRIQNREHQIQLAQLSSEAENILTMEKQLAELTLQHAQELGRATEQHAKELRELEDRLQKNFTEELCVSLDKVQKEERKRMSEELSQHNLEEQSKLREQLQAESDQCMVSLRKELQQAAMEERKELDQQLAQAQELLVEERRRLEALQTSLNSEESPQVVAMKLKLEAQYESELRTAKSTMAAEVKELNALLQQQTETRLQEALSRHQEEQRQLTERLALQRDADLTEQRHQHAQELQSQRVLMEQHIFKLQDLEKEHQELKTRHQEELTSLSADHKKALHSLETKLSEKHRTELDKLQMILEETNLAQLEAQEAELVTRHKQELDELETRMLSNMDTLETTYLKEIQAVREEKEEMLQQLKSSLERQHAKRIERVREEELSVRDQLRRELAQVHMDKFTAMATELRQAHQEELSAALTSQKAALETGHRSVLETLRQHVLELEKQHSAALQEVTDMTTLEKQQSQQELDMLMSQHQQQLQELKAASAREMEALQRELEEKSSQQCLHFLKEAELFKSKSEEQLQQKIAQIKEDCEREKAAALEELKNRLREEHQQNELCYKDKMNQLTSQLQQLDTVVSQLRAELTGLQGELEGKRSEMETLETLLQRRERESQEGANLLAMLRDDLNTATQQRHNLQLAHENLQQVLLEMLRITLATEEQISHRLEVCVYGNCAEVGTSNRTPRDGHLQESAEADSDAVGDGGNCSIFSSVTDEGLELSQRLCESLFSGPEGELGSEREELVLGACTRLRTAVDKLLELVSESTVQLKQLQALQAALDEQFSESGEGRNNLLLQHTRLLEQLDQESSLKGQLQLELHKAEGLVEGYVAEKAALEEALQQKEVREQKLVEELERTRTQLHELGEEHTLLLRQKDALSASLGEPEKALLAETERLGQERVDIQRQSEKDRVGLVARLRSLEVTLEEQEARVQQQEEQHRTQTEDLQQHIDALEKQLKHHRQFIDEQAVEREHERDEFQQEIKNLESQLRMPSKGHAGGGCKGQRVESLQALIKDKTEDYSALLSAKAELQQDLEDRNEEIEKMACRIRDLEQALLSSVEAGRAVTQLEQELQKGRKSLLDMSQDKEALQQQLYSNKLQISALQSKLDETRHRVPDPTANPDPREQLEVLKQDLQSKEEQVEVLLERVEVLEKALEVKGEDIRHLTLQLELKTQESRAKEEQLELHISELQETVSTLRRQQQVEGTDSELQLPAALLEEKNLEIDHLNQQILHLQQELDTTNENKTTEEKQSEIEELRAQVEHLRGDQERLRQDKEEETEQLHEVINKLQEELSQLDPNRHEISDPNTDSPESSDFPWSPRPQLGTEESLCHELSSQTLQSCRTKISELRVELEHSTEEKEALQRLLHSQEEQYGQQVEALGRSLGEDRGKLVLLEQEAGELKIQLAEKEAQVEKLHDRIHKLEDGERNLKDLELQFKRVNEKRKEAKGELAQLSEEVRRQKEERERLEAQVQVLETGKEELYTEKQALQRHEVTLQEEIERLKQELTSRSIQIRELNMQLEERQTDQEEAQKEVLTCAEETLAKAEAALREREEQLANLRAEHDLLRAELASVKEGLSSSTERADKLREEGQSKDRALADLEEHNQRLRAELRSLQDDLEVQEEELAYQQKELEELRQRYSHQELVETRGSKREQRFLDGLSPDTSLSSPEVLRRLDCSEGPHSHLHASHLSELSGLRNTSLELTSRHSPVERIERNQHKRPLMLPSETDAPSTRSPSASPRSPSASPRSLSISENLSVLDSLDTDKVQELENMEDVTSHSPLGSTSPVSVPEWASDGYGSNGSSELEAKLRQELEHTERLDAHFVEYLRGRGMAPAPPSDSAAGSLQYNELLSPELQTMLNRVYQESCRVLSLSRRPMPAGQSHSDLELAPPPSWQRERRALQETVLSLRELLCRMAEREPKTDGDVDWRGELLQAVRSVFDSEREWLHAQLQNVMETAAPLDYASLLEQIEKLLQKQEEQQRRFLEQLLSADRNSLLAEIRSLHAQLHSCTLQSQEQLRELQTTLHTVREHGVLVQQQLRKQADDVERQLQEEKTTSQNLRRSLEQEQTRLGEQHLQLTAEQKVVSVLKAELESRTLQMHSASKSQEELQSQIHNLRLRLESEEQERQTCVEAVERERVRVKQLQEELHHERLSSLHKKEESAQAHESLRVTLNEQASRLNEMNSALEQERVLVSNLRAELQIEQSRCEALLAQEHERTELALARLDEERSRTAGLSRTLSQQAQEHARRLEKEARSQETTNAHDRKFIQELQAQLDQERRQAEELAATVERLQTQVLEGKRRQEKEVQDEIKRLHAALEALQAQRVEVSRNLEAERQRASLLQTELDAMKGKMTEVKERERMREEQREKQRWREKQEQEDKERRQERTKEKLLELEALRERDQQRLKQLQQTLADLEHQEKQLTSERLHRELHTTDSTIISHTQGSPSSSLLDRVLKENSELAERLAALSEEKISLKHTLSCLERDLHNLKHTKQERSSVQLDQSTLAEKLAWQREKATLQSALHKAQDELTKATSRNENRPLTDLSNNKLQRLYERYLRAESYRKSLVYQKRYLLLLLGGFQDCEQATLALIARMGAHPSLGQTQASRPINRFRSAVRVVIAISRLKFLTRKWQRATRKNSLGSGMINSAALRTEVLKPQQSGASFNSPPTRDLILSQRSVVSSLIPAAKSPFRLHNRSYPSSVPTLSEHTPTPSQDQERSLADYIHHLEAVQQRLGAIRPGSPSVFSYPRKSDR